VSCNHRTTTFIQSRARSHHATSRHAKEEASHQDAEEEKLVVARRRACQGAAPRASPEWARVGLASSRTLSRLAVPHRRHGWPAASPRCISASARSDKRYSLRHQTVVAQREGMGRRDAPSLPPEFVRLAPPPLRHQRRQWSGEGGVRGRSRRRSWSPRSRPCG
jgi:hypothetical protein